MHLEGYESAQVSETVPNESRDAARLDTGRLRPGRRAEAYRKSRRVGKAKRCENATTWDSSPRNSRPAEPWPNRPASTDHGPGMDFPDRVAYAIIVGVAHARDTRD